ncbi:hypothetical protein SIN04_15870 [Methylocella tundrae]|nr:hypothetical protein [Methylocella tundrae]WPP03918.1 hypothetical protein SIN04_15870 [Methylocella tundrae]
MAGGAETSHIAVPPAIAAQMLAASSVLIEDYVAEGLNLENLKLQCSLAVVTGSFTGSVGAWPDVGCNLLPVYGVDAQVPQREPRPFVEMSRRDVGRIRAQPESVRHFQLGKAQECFAQTSALMRG